MSQLQWLEDKHRTNLTKLRRAGSLEQRVQVCVDAASEFQRATVEWDRTFELIHEWLARATELLPERPGLQLLEAYAPAAEGLVDKSVFYDLQVAKPADSSRRGVATTDVALTLSDYAERHPGSWRVVRAAADSMAHLVLGSLRCDYRLDFDPYAYLKRIALAQLASGSPDGHVLEVYLDSTAERLTCALQRREAGAATQWEEFRALVRQTSDLEVVAGPYCKAVAARVKAKAYPDAAWLDAEVQLITTWWFAEDRWFGVRAKLHAQLDTCLRDAIEAAPNDETRQRYQHLLDAYVETLPDWE